MAIHKIIFDVGQVLINFSPKNLFLKIFKTEQEVDYFLKNICTWEWHLKQDVVYDTSKVAGPMVEQYPEYKDAIEAFYGRFLEMINYKHEENIQLALDLKNKGYKIYILSNFPGDQFEKYRLENSFIDRFDDRIISGDVGVMKPNPKIYELAIEKFNLIPEETLFIDDKIENTDSAAKLGIKTIQLTNPKSLTELIKKYV